MRAQATLAEMRRIFEEIEDMLPPSECELMAGFLEREESDRIWVTLAGHTWQLFSVSNPELFEKYWIRLGITGDLAADMLDTCGRITSMYSHDPGHA